MPPRTQSTETQPVRLPCACANVRRAARVVTQFYDRALRPAGIRATQFTLLQALHMAPGMSQKKLSELLAIDSTTLTRTLAPLRRARWLDAEAGADRRELSFRLTAAGRREYERALPYWQAAQKALERALGKDGWDRLMKAAVRTAGTKPELR